MQYFKSTHDLFSGRTESAQDAHMLGKGLGQLSN